MERGQAQKWRSGGSSLQKLLCPNMQGNVFLARPLKSWRRRENIQKDKIRADFRGGDEDSNFSVFRVRWFTEWPRPLHWIAFPVEILTRTLIHWIASPHFTEKGFFSLKSASSHPLPKNWLWQDFLEKRKARTSKKQGKEDHGCDFSEVP